MLIQYRDFLPISGYEGTDRFPALVQTRWISAALPCCCQPREGGHRHLPDIRQMPLPYHHSLSFPVLPVRGSLLRNQCACLYADLRSPGSDGAGCSATQPHPGILSHDPGIMESLAVSLYHLPSRNIAKICFPSG